MMPYGLLWWPRCCYYFRAVFCYELLLLLCMGSVMTDDLFMLAFSWQNRARLADALIILLVVRERRHHEITRRYISRSTWKEPPNLALPLYSESRLVANNAASPT
jgi:hypothetical protein